MGIYDRLMCPTNAYGIANNVDPDQIRLLLQEQSDLGLYCLPPGAVWSGSTTSDWAMFYPKLCCYEPRYKGVWAFDRLDDLVIEPPHDKTNKMTVRLANTQISLGIGQVWSESLLSAWRNTGFSTTHWAHSEDPYQTGRMLRLIWVFAGRAVILLVLSCGGSIIMFTRFGNKLWRCIILKFWFECSAAKSYQSINN